MKKGIALFTSLAGLLVLTMANPAFAAEGKEITISGDGKCAKCALKETAKCQNAIQTKEDGKTVTYYLVKNDLSDKFHGNVCQETKKVKATGTLKEIDGKKELTVTKLDLVK